MGQWGIHCSPFGVIPKKGRANKWRLILDLSSPEGRSVNNSIPSEWSTLSYVSVDYVVDQLLDRTGEVWLAKMDVLVHPEDRWLLGMEWQGHTYVDTALPFGLRSAPLLFTVLADMAQWVMEQRGVTWVAHYIDNFITLGTAAECRENMQRMRETLRELGLPNRT